MVIRKLSIGNDYKSAMHYLQNQSVLNDNYIIHLIKITDIGSYQIYIEKNNEVILWKEIGAYVPVIIEYDISF
jgi:hypothetical protein